MEIVKAYKTADGQLHDNQLEAENQDLMIAMRGLIQSHIRVGTGGTLSVTEVATLLAKNETIQEKFYVAIQKHRRKVSDIKRREKV